MGRASPFTGPQFPEYIEGAGPDGAELLFSCDMLMFMRRPTTERNMIKPCQFSFSKFSVYFFLIRRQNVIRPYARLIVPKTEFKHLNMFARGKQSGGSCGELGLIPPQGEPPRGLWGALGAALGSRSPSVGRVCFPCGLTVCKAEVCACPCPHVRSFTLTHSFPLET